MGREIPREGQIFGNLTIIKPRAENRKYAYYHLCRCVCGTEKMILSSNVELGKTKSCGCAARKATGERARTHGMSKTSEYQTWNRMWSRCTNPVVDRYPQYGGRGISVCKDWESFENFYRDMGDRPSPRHSIGRKDNDGNYCKDNCRWETPDQQSSNTSRSVFIEHLGERLTISQWAKKLGMSQYLIRSRLSLGWSGADSLRNENLHEKPITVDGVSMLTTEWIKHLSIPVSSFYVLIRRGISREDVIRKYLDKSNSPKHLENIKQLKGEKNG